MKISDSIIKRIKGFGLIEVLLSTVVLGVGLVGVAQFQGNVYKDGSLSKQRAEALKLAEKKLEELRHFSTIAEYQSNITSSLTNMKTAQSTVSGDTTTFTLYTYIKPELSGKTADLSVKVTWPDLINSGSVTADTTVQLSTVVSNNTPNSLAMTDFVPVLDTATDPDIPLIEIWIPADTRTNVADNADACSCSETTTTASLDPSIFGDSNFRRVGMMGGGGSTTTVTPGLTEACTECCTEIGGIWARIQTDTLYAQLLNELEALLNKNVSNYKKINSEDRVIGQSDFNPDFLQKGYQSKKHNAAAYDNQPRLTDYERFLHKTMNKSSTTTTTNYGLCGYVKTTTTWRNRMMGSWSQ